MIINSKFKCALSVIPVSDVMRYGPTLTICQLVVSILKYKRSTRIFKGKFSRNVKGKFSRIHAFGHV